MRRHVMNGNKWFVILGAQILHIQTKSFNICFSVNIENLINNLFNCNNIYYLKYTFPLKAIIPHKNFFFFSGFSGEKQNLEESFLKRFSFSFLCIICSNDQRSLETWSVGNSYHRNIFHSHFSLNSHHS